MYQQFDGYYYIFHKILPSKKEKKKFIKKLKYETWKDVVRLELYRATVGGKIKENEYLLAMNGIEAELGNLSKNQFRAYKKSVVKWMIILYHF